MSGEEFLRLKSNEEAKTRWRSFGPTPSSGFNGGGRGGNREFYAERRFLGPKTEAGDLEDRLPVEKSVREAAAESDGKVSVGWRWKKARRANNNNNRNYNNNNHDNHGSSVASFEEIQVGRSEAEKDISGDDSSSSSAELGRFEVFWRLMLLVIAILATVGVVTACMAQFRWMNQGD